MDDYFLRHATRDQLIEYARRSNEMQEIERMMRDPPIYRPIRDCCGIVLATSFQCDHPTNYKMALYGIDGRIDSFRAIINGKKQENRGGWHHWLAEIAKITPSGMGALYGEAS